MLEKIVFRRDSNRIYFIFLTNVLKKTWNYFNSKFWPQSKYRKGSYQIKQIFALFFNLVALTLGLKSVKSFRITKIVKEITFQRVFNKLASLRGFQRQPVTKHLRLPLVFMWNRVLRETFNRSFLGREATLKFLTAVREATCIQHLCK